MPTEMSIRELYQLAKDGTTLELDQLDFIQLQGWVRTNRAGKEHSLRMHRLCILLILFPITLKLLST